jgi:transposase
MESTGSYWIPIFNLLEGHFAVVLANPEEVKTRKGHKTDRKDAEHLADLLRHSHIRSSYKEANYLQFVDAHTTLADFTASF